MKRPESRARVSTPGLERRVGFSNGASIKIACLQYEPKIGEKKRNVAKSLQLLRRAKNEGATLCILPELCNTGYMFSSRTEAYEAAEAVPDGTTSREWIDFAHSNNVYIAAGITEIDGSRLYNSQVFIAPYGYVGKHRKVHLWFTDKLYFEPGDLGYQVFVTPIGRLSGLICYDLWFPEASRILAVQGADIICISTNWVPLPGQEKDRLPMADYLCIVNSHVNGIFIAAADRIGTERGQPFIGSSVITDATGWPLGGPASYDKEELIFADVDLTRARRSRQWNALNNPLTDRRIDVFDSLLGYKPTTPVVKYLAK
jgi:predicted amidohydrolase